MNLTEQLQADMKDAMRNGDAFRRDTLRMVLAAVQNAEKDKRSPLTEDEAQAVLTRQVKTRRESVKAFEDAGREDLAAKERAEIEVLAPYLPEQLDESAVQALVREAITSTGASSPRDMGRVMGALMPRVKGRADGAVVRRLVNEELAKSVPAE